MADNILKNEFMWEKKKEKKKLYKNWKLYAIALGITVIGAGTGLGVYYGVFANHSDVIKIDLSTLEFETTISGKEKMTEEDAFNEFISNNTNITDLKDNVEVGTFTVPTYTSTGSLVINATATGKYTGTITVTINAIRQTNLKDLTGIIKEVASSTTENNALQAFLDANKNTYPDLAGNVTFNENSFKAPNYTTTGSYTIIANESGKYTGAITVTINAIGQTNLNDLTDLNTILTEAITDKQTAFQAFLDLNKEKYSDLKDNVEAETFREPSYITDGSLEINAIPTGKYTGTITVSISKIGQIDLNTVKLETTISGTENMTQKIAFTEFLNINKDIADLENNVESGTFIRPKYTESGSLTINATTTGKYTGVITVIINEIGQTNLNDLTDLNTTLTRGYIKKDDAFQAFLNLNQEKYPDLETNVEAGLFYPPSVGTGSLTINTISTGKYTGSIKLTLPAIDRNQALQNIVDASQNDSDDIWQKAWYDYFNLFLWRL